MSRICTQSNVLDIATGFDTSNYFQQSKIDTLPHPQHQPGVVDQFVLLWEGNPPWGPKAKWVALDETILTQVVPSISVWGHPTNNYEGAQRFTMEFPCWPCSPNMFNIQPYLRTLLDIRCRNSCTIFFFLLHRLTQSHFHSEVLMDWVHLCPDLTGTNPSSISVPRWFSCKWHPGVRTLHYKEWSTCCFLGQSVISSKLSQRAPLNPINLLMLHKHSKILFHTGIYSFCLSIRLWMKSCQHSSINPQPTA